MFAFVCLCDLHWSFSCICCCIFCSISCILFSCTHTHTVSRRGLVCCLISLHFRSVHVYYDYDSSLTSSSFILMSRSVSASGVGSGRMGIGLSIRLSCVSLLQHTRNTTLYSVCQNYSTPKKTVQLSKLNTTFFLI